MRLSVESTISPPGRTRAAATPQERAHIWHVLDHLEAGDEVERGALGNECLGLFGAVGDGEAVVRRMRLGDADDLLRRVDRRYRGAHARERLGDEAGTAADVERREARERLEAGRRSPEVRACRIADEAHARRAEPVQGAHGAVGVPPLRRERIEAADLRRVQRRRRAAVRFECARCHGSTRKANRPACQAASRHAHHMDR